MIRSCRPGWDDDRLRREGVIGHVGRDVPLFDPERPFVCSCLSRPVMPLKRPLPYPTRKVSGGW